MGCFDYECQCGGNTCKHVGRQLHDAHVVIAVPLNDRTVVHIKGYYEQYGYVVVGDYKFYPEQFEDYFEDWFSDQSENERNKGFLASKIWTQREEIMEDDDEESHMVRRECCPITHFKTVTSSLIGKCIRADKGLSIPTDKEKRETRIKEIEVQILRLQKELTALKSENL